MGTIDKLKKDIIKVVEERDMLYDIVFGPDIKIDDTPVCICTTLRIQNVDRKGFEFIGDLVMVNCNRCGAEQVYLVEDVRDLMDTKNRNKTKRRFYGEGGLMS